METEEEFGKSIRENENERYILRLFVAGFTPRSQKAIKNIKQILSEYEGNFDLEIIDIYQNPIIARDGQIIGAPTLLKELPPPVRRFIGDMSDINKIVLGLDLKKKKKE